jgi:hypothetical protein
VTSLGTEVFDRQKSPKESLIKFSLSTASKDKVAPDEAKDTGDDEWV